MYALTWRNNYNTSAFMSLFVESDRFGLRICQMTHNGSKPKKKPNASYLFLFFIFFGGECWFFLKFIKMSYGPLLRYLLLNFSFVIYSYLMNLQNLLEVKSQLLVNLRWLEVFLKQQWRKLWLNRRIPSFRSQ